MDLAAAPVWQVGAAVSLRTAIMVLMRLPAVALCRMEAMVAHRPMEVVSLTVASVEVVLAPLATGTAAAVADIPAAVAAATTVILEMAVAAALTTMVSIRSAWQVQILAPAR